MPIDVHAVIDPQDRINEIAEAWQKMDGAAALRTIVMQAREAKAEAEYRVVELKNMRKKRFWGCPGVERRWHLHMAHVPQSQANGTYARLGAPVKMENMNLHRHGYHGGGPPLDVRAATAQRYPPRKARTPAPDRINQSRRAQVSYDWYGRGHDTPHDPRRALRGVPRHVVSSNFSSNTADRFEKTTRAGPDFETFQAAHSRSQKWSTTGRFRDFSSLEPKLSLSTPVAEVAPKKSRTNRVSRADLDRVDRDPLYHPLGSTVDRGRPDPADLCDETLAAYRATLILGRSRAPP
jgi:hypothetical protein